MRKIISDRSRKILNLISRKIKNDDKVVEIKYSSEGIFKEEEDKKELASEVPVQKQVININKLRIENGLEPIKGIADEFIKIK